MRWMIASDIHGSAYYCREMLEAFSREKADRLLLLGDILYHGPRNDLPREYAPKEVFGMLNEYKDRIFCVRGNCDTDATHGHRFNRNSLPPLQQGDILLHGHTHVPAWETFGNDNYYFNPGSVSIPKADSPHSYMVLEETLWTWKTLEGDTFHEEKL